MEALKFETGIQPENSKQGERLDSSMEVVDEEEEKEKEYMR